MSFGFNTPQPELTPTLSSGLPTYEHLVKLKGGDTIRFVPLHGTSECLSVWVHQSQQKYDGGFKYVPVASKNSHLGFDPFPSPFETDPREKVNKIKLARFMLVYVVDGHPKLKGHVAILELRSNSKKKGTYDELHNWEEQSGKSVEGRLCTLTRTGNGLQDTTYNISVLDTRELSDKEMETVGLEAPEVQEYLVGLYAKPEVWTAEKFQQVYATAIVDGDAPVQETKPVPETFDDVEIPF